MKCFNFVIHIHFGSGHLGIPYEKVRYPLRSERGWGLVVRVYNNSKYSRKPAGWRWVIVGLTKMSKSEWVLKAAAHSVISFIFLIFPWLCKIIRNKRKICWMPSHSLLEQENKPFQATLWFAVSGRIIHRGESQRADHVEWLFSDVKLQMAQAESTKVWIILKNLLKKFCYWKVCTCMTKYDVYNLYDLISI